MFVGSVEDRLKIRELFDAYSDATCRADRVAYLACWAEDGVRTGAGGEARGKAALSEHWSGIWTVIEQMVFLVQIGSIEVTGDEASTRSYCQEILRFKNGGVQRLVGKYEDELRRVGGEWVFAHRDYEVILNEGAVASGN